MYRANNPRAPGMNTFGEYDNYQNTSDSYTHVSYKRNPGYFERVGSSFFGIAVGFVLLIGSFPLLFWNEGRAVQTAKSLNEGLAQVTSLSSIDVLFDSNNNKLVHLSGKIRTDLPLTDGEFAINVHAVHLRRHVEMYQWTEKEHKREYNEGDRTRVETTYSYSMEWRSEVIKSGGFSNPTNHRNPNSMPVKGYSISAEPVFLGIFQLSTKLKSSINDFKTIIPKVKPEHRDDLVLHDKYFYRSKDAYRPQVGDVRIWFSYAGLSLSDDSSLGNPADVSVIARQNGPFLSAYKTEAGDSLELLYPGVKSAKEIFDAEHASNTLLTWVLRFAGWLMMFIAFQVMMDILRQIVSFIPIVRDLVSLATSLIAFTFASSLSLITIALGWLAYRPFLAIAILMGAAVPFILSRQKAEREKQKGMK